MVNENELRNMSSEDVEIYRVDEDDTGLNWEDLTTEYEYRFTCEVAVGGFKYKAELIQDKTISDEDAWVYGKIYPSDEEGFENCPVYQDKFYTLSEAQELLEFKLEELIKNE